MRVGCTGRSTWTASDRHANLLTMTTSHGSICTIEGKKTSPATKGMTLTSIMSVSHRGVMGTKVPEIDLTTMRIGEREMMQVVSRDLLFYSIQCHSKITVLNNASIHE